MMGQQLSRERLAVRTQLESAVGLSMGLSLRHIYVYVCMVLDCNLFGLD